MPLRPRTLPTEYEPICEQFLTNLLAAGYEIINPQGENITTPLIQEAIRKIKEAAK